MKDVASSRKCTLLVSMVIMALVRQAVIIQEGLRGVERNSWCELFPLGSNSIRHATGECVTPRGIVAMGLRQSPSTLEASLSTDTQIHKRLLPGSRWADHFYGQPTVSSDHKACLCDKTEECSPS
uniref:Secreted protein n=1 Tax=Molossus molossus TaxID=27622 RepID=A0A7J8DTX6_MOLMO|nr:hypothetical protein HJG59_009176 [Molossus molossus]